LVKLTGVVPNLGVIVTEPVVTPAVYIALYVPLLLSVTVPMVPVLGVTNDIVAPPTVILLPVAFFNCIVIVEVPLVGITAGETVTVEVTAEGVCAKSNTPLKPKKVNLLERVI
jgi:hypothetical protein